MTKSVYYLLAAEVAYYYKTCTNSDRPRANELTLTKTYVSYWQRQDKHTAETAPALSGSTVKFHLKLLKTDTPELSDTAYVCMLYTVNHKKRDILFLTMTLVNLNRFL